MSTVLVTGVNGFVGKHVAKEFAENGYQVVGVGGPKGGDPNSSHVHKYLALDLTDPEAANNIDFSTIDSVVHLAGLANTGQSFGEPLEFIKTNIGIEIHLFEAAMKQDKHPRFLVISSGSLYDPTADLPLTEESRTKPNSPYAVSKLGQEQMAQYYSNRGFEYIVARPFNHIGPGQRPGFIVPEFTRQVMDIAEGRATEIKVGNLDTKRDYADVRDISRAYRLLIEQGRTGEVYNICTGTSRSGKEILSLISNAVGIEPKVETDPSKMRPSDTPDIYGSHDKLTKDTGWQPEISLDQTIHDIVEDFRSQQA